MLSALDKNLVFVGSTSKQIIAFDKRQSEPVATFTNDAMVNTMYVSDPSFQRCTVNLHAVLRPHGRYVYKNGEFLLSGDSVGNIKLWDLKSPHAPLDKVENEEGKLVRFIPACASVS